MRNACKFWSKSVKEKRPLRHLHVDRRISINMDRWKLCENVHWRYLVQKPPDNEML